MTKSGWNIDIVAESRLAKPKLTLEELLVIRVEPTWKSSSYLRVIVQLPIRNTQPVMNAASVDFFPFPQT